MAFILGGSKVADRIADTRTRGMAASDGQDRDVAAIMDIVKNDALEDCTLHQLQLHQSTLHRFIGDPEFKRLEQRDLLWYRAELLSGLLDQNTGVGVMDLKKAVEGCPEVTHILAKHEESFYDYVEASLGVMQEADETVRVFLQQNEAALTKVCLSTTWCAKQPRSIEYPS